MIVTQEQRSAVPVRRDARMGNLGRWMSLEEFAKAKAQRFPGCMIGKMERVFWTKCLTFPYFKLLMSL